MPYAAGLYERRERPSSGRARRPAALAPTQGAARVLSLQRTIGNRRVAALVARQAQELPGQPKRISRERFEEILGAGSTEEMRRARDWLAVQLGLVGGMTTPEVEGREEWMERYRNLSRYIAERGNSTLADADVELHFDGTTLSMTGSRSLSWPAVSGRSVGDDRFDYSPGRQQLSREGPIPEGDYWIDPSQLAQLSGRVSTGIADWWSDGAYSRAWGTHRITIHPFDATQTYGRGGFFIHGGAERGSAGCIDLTSSMPDFARAIATVPAGHKVKLYVRYPRAGDYPLPAGAARAA
jgi:hypothetical protein